MEVKLTKEEFTKLYMDTSKTLEQLSEELGVSVNKLVRAAKKLNLSRRVTTNKLVIED